MKKKISSAISLSADGIAEAGSMPEQSGDGHTVERIKDLPEIDRIVTIPPRILQILEKLNISGEDARATAKAFSEHLATKVKEGAAVEELRELYRIQQELENLLQKPPHVESGEVAVDLEVVKITLRAKEFAEIATKLHEGATPTKEEIQQVAPYLRRQNWGNLLREGALNKGDRLVTILVPGAEFLSIKNLNDKIFGPQITDKIIAKKRQILSEKMQALGAESLQQDYKTETFSFRDSQPYEQQKVEEVLEAADKEMTDFVVDLARQELSSAAGNEKRKEVLLDFISKLTGSQGKSGFRMTYGVSEVGEANEQEVLLAAIRAQQECRLSRGHKQNYGGEFNVNEVFSEVETIKALRQEIIDSGNTILSNGVRFTIFVEQEKRMTLNKDVLRAARKGKIKIDSAQEALLAKVQMYIQKLNLLDVIKPFTAEEVNNGGLRKELSDTEILTRSLEEGKLTDSQRGELVKKLKLDARDNNFTSANEFHAEALKMSNCRYVTIDALDVGVDQILEHEKAIAQLEGASELERDSKLRDASLSAGDKTTQRLKEFRAIAADVVREKTGNTAAPIVGLVGGDELTLAFNTSIISPEVVDKIISEIRNRVRQGKSQEGTELRIIETVASEADKYIANSASEQEKAVAHADALKRAETGSAVAKYIEDNLRDVNRLISLLSGSVAHAGIEESGLKNFFLVENDKDGDPVLVKADFIIKEHGGNFIVKAGRHEMLYDDLSVRMKKMQKNLANYS